MQLKLIHEIHSVDVVSHADSESEIRLSLSVTERKFCRSFLMTRLHAIPVIGAIFASLHVAYSPSPGISN